MSMNSLYGTSYGYNYLYPNLTTTAGVTTPVTLTGNVANTGLTTDNVNLTTETKKKDEDDGKIGFWKGVGNFFKGAAKAVVNTVKGVLTDPKKLLLTAGAIALSIACPPAGVALAVAGGVAGAVTVGKGVYKAATATTDAEAEAAFQEMGGGALQVGLSVVGAKAGIKAMKGVEGSAMSSATGLKGNVTAYIKDAKASITGGNGYNGVGVVKNIKAAGFEKGNRLGAIKDGIKTSYDDFKGGSDVKLTEALKSKAEYVKNAGEEANISKATKAANEALDKLDDAGFDKAMKALEKAEAGKGAYTAGVKKVLSDYRIKNLVKNDPAYKAANEKFYNAATTADEQAALAEISQIISKYAKITAKDIGTIGQVGAYSLDTQSGPAAHLAQSYTPATITSAQELAYTPQYQNQVLPEMTFNESTGMWA